jgi:hypothetical protein
MTESGANSDATATVVKLAQRVAELEREVVERRQSESLQRALYEIASLSTADSPEHEHYVRLHEIVGQLMYANNFIIATYDAEHGLIRQEYLVDEDPNEVKETFPYGEAVPTDDQELLAGDPQPPPVADGSRAV